MIHRGRVGYERSLMGKDLRRFVPAAIVALVAVVGLGSFARWPLDRANRERDTKLLPSGQAGEPDVRGVPARELPRAVARAPGRTAPPGQEADGQDAGDPEAVFDEGDLVYEDPDAIAAA